MFIIIRWVSYSIIFLARDYYGTWKPFTPVPFGLQVNTYAFFQKCFSVLFGIFLMYSISIGLSGYLQVIKKSIPPVKILNILGVTFFLPWIIVQVIDVIIITTTGWVESIVIPVHTLVLVWEGWAATEIISGMCNLKSSEKVLSIAVIMVVWILICAVLWR